MHAHRTIWKITGTALVLALAVLANRAGGAAYAYRAAAKDAAESQEADSRVLIALLCRDPRVRRPGTQGQVERVAHYARVGTSVSAHSCFALGLQHFYREGNRADAESAFRRAIQLAPLWSWPYNALAIVLFDVGRETEAEAAWEQAIELDPGWSRPYSDRAILYRRAGRMDEAHRSIEKALELEPEGAIPRYNYGVLLDWQGRHVEARKVYLEVIELDPGLPAPHYNLACSHGREGRLEAALGPLEVAIRLNEVFRDEALEDPDFAPIRDRPAFKKLLEAPVETPGMP